MKARIRSSNSKMIIYEITLSLIGCPQKPLFALEKQIHVLKACFRLADEFKNQTKSNSLKRVKNE